MMLLQCQRDRQQTLMCDLAMSPRAPIKPTNGPPDIGIHRWLPEEMPTRLQQRGPRGKGSKEASLEGAGGKPSVSGSQTVLQRTSPSRQGAGLPAWKHCGQRCGHYPCYL
ncbi:hypothetical protein BC832DRAFT_550839 [Gaertneriomyces semiglobifer]|nr:hypothetical protein BC832DRAFT_550839 [Gaertneriomyces semiglobifer]